MRATLGGDEGVDLVDDDGVNGAQSVGGLRGEQQIERLRSGDENVGGLARESGTLALRRVASTDADGGFAEGNAHAAGLVGHAGQGRTEIALYVDGKGLERRNVEDAATLAMTLRQRLQHETVETPEKRGESFAGTSRGEDEGALTTRDDRPARTLRGGGRIKNSAEPGLGDRVEAGKWGRCFLGIGLGWGHAL